ncbi:hypothetical protein E3P89_01887 [Wallemia ichthyophaga]|uniref:Uncharacterized protein n=1 Tax=Wallemia ichthyophaga TaxID=245174 RepID=A0A4T0HHV2_WALIC|nr:hypothetical protein E3P90_00886 [Wallemia ichthyophaga]TIB17278.1 hypothetical protein E3P93_00743 [Wallemia ichthyophaga]TIB22862.1 hypothetical protein E3P89_01887 [Wallemia ichthyophaga]TIB26781.1 hypothetical protein E3P88_00751 [Wallemia ichthyophaga]
MNHNHIQSYPSLPPLRHNDWIWRVKIRSASEILREIWLPSITLIGVGVCLTLLKVKLTLHSIPGFNSLCHQRKEAVYDTFTSFQIPDYQRKRTLTTSSANPNAVQHAFGDQQEEPVGIDLQPAHSKKVVSRGGEEEEVAVGLEVEGKSRARPGAKRNSISLMKVMSLSTLPRTHTKQSQEVADEQDESVASTSTSRYQTRSQTRKKESKYSHKPKSAPIKVEMRECDYAYVNEYKQGLL